MLYIDLNNKLHEYCCSMGSDVERPGKSFQGTCPFHLFVMGEAVCKKVIQNAGGHGNTGYGLLKSLADKLPDCTTLRRGNQQS
jgi:hypothetical protein